MNAAVSRTLAGLESALTRLEADGLVVRTGDGFHTTRRWQGAMARAALRLYAAGDPGHDLRVPIASALIEIYASEVDSGFDDEEIASLIEAILPVEVRALGLRGG